MASPLEDISLESTRLVSQRTFEDWTRRHRNDPDRYEYLSGRIVTTPPAGYPHGEIESAVVRWLHQHVNERGFGKIFGSGQGFELPSGDSLAPDASYVSKERWLAAPTPESGRFLRVVPNLVVEILSLSTAQRDRGEKRVAYGLAGVEELWLIDWRAREIVVYNANAGSHKLDVERAHAEKEAIVSRVLPELILRFVDLLPDLVQP